MSRKSSSITQSAICNFGLQPMIRGLIRSERSSIKTNNKENDIVKCKCPKNEWTATVEMDDPQLLNFEGNPKISEEMEI